MITGAVYTHVFNEPGVYRYVCTQHERNGMVGMVIVSRPTPASPRARQNRRASRAVSQSVRARPAGSGRLPVPPASPAPARSRAGAQ
ncbi:MAG: plastocyanin/azurin family copper-binding protein [Terriglobales bacterium]